MGLEWWGWVGRRDEKRCCVGGCFEEASSRIIYDIIPSHYLNHCLIISHEIECIHLGDLLGKMSGSAKTKGTKGEN